eukprot:6953099-Prymnesium_polylepis.4
MQRARPSLLPLAIALQDNNFYVTTIHCINSAIVKMSKLTKVTKVHSAALPTRDSVSKAARLANTPGLSWSCQPKASRVFEARQRAQR